MPELCVSAIVVDDERLLLVRRGRGRAQGTWSLPGGRVADGETLAEGSFEEVSNNPEVIEAYLGRPIEKGA